MLRTGLTDPAYSKTTISHLPDESFVRLPSVLALTGCCRTSIYGMMASGDFPKPYQLGGAKTRAVGWRLSDVKAWLKTRIPQESGVL